MLSNISNLQHLDSENFFLFAGPCVVESKKMVFDIAERIKNITDRLKIPFVFKASYRKANRSRLDSFTGIGDDKALKILHNLREQMNIPVITDVHTIEETIVASLYVDILQIPAFLCRQTDMLIAAARTGKFVNIKKGQFASAQTMVFAAQKIIESGNPNVMITERGTMFGYNDLVIDYRSIPEMQKANVPVVLDITHSLQQPNQSSGVTGGRPDLIETVARAGIAVAVDGIFLETHPSPEKAKSDGANMLHLDKLEGMLERLVILRKAVNEMKKIV